jgi:predicted dienelactone hydrolase
MPLRTLAFAAFIALTGAIALAENRIDLIRPDAPALAQHGALPVGVTTLTFTRPDQIDITRATATAQPTGDRTLTVEIWYPAAEDTSPGTTYETILRDGATPVTLEGRAARDAEPLRGKRYPLVILSHGYPGNRFLMAHLGENLASKGYVVASIDHPQSTYDDQGVFAATLFHRPSDQRFVLDSLALLQSPLGNIINDQNTAVIGYSMGGYGALILAGGGVTEAATAFSYAPPAGLLARHQAGSETLAALTDPRVKAVVAIGPWGRTADFWGAEGLGAIRTPLLLVAGSVDDVSRYDAIRRIFAETRGATRHLLTFDNANHNAGAPIPAPFESWQPVETLDFVPFDHYADPVWDSVRMNNITQHFVTAFLDIHLKGDVTRADFLRLVPNAIDGVDMRDEAGSPIAGHTYWAGFPPRTAVGLRFETLQPGN